MIRQSAVPHDFARECGQVSLDKATTQPSAAFSPLIRSLLTLNHLRFVFQDDLQHQ